MTRINVGIHPEELCDQHLLAEIRELPRVIGVKIATKPPDKFKLGTGHVAWCAQYQSSLHGRLLKLEKEASYRGFQVNIRLRRVPNNNSKWTVNDEIFAAKIIRDRIGERLDTMNSHVKNQHHPRWTNRLVPVRDI
jgi:hypothetical protein